MELDILCLRAYVRIHGDVPQDDPSACEIDRCTYMPEDEVEPQTSFANDRCILFIMSREISVV